MIVILNYTSSYLFAFFLAFIPAIINFALACFVFFKLPRRTVTILFVLDLIFTGFWQLGTAMSRISSDAATANFWNCIFMPFALLSAPLILHFSVVFTKRDKNKQLLWMVYALYFVTFIMAMVYPVFTTIAGQTVLDFWGWVNTRLGSPYYALIGVFLQLQFYFAIGIMTYSLVKTKKKTDIYYQLLLLDISLLAIVLIGFISEVIVPFMFNTNPIPVTPTFVSLFSIAFYIALSRFRMFAGIDNISKDDLLASISDIVIVVDGNLNISYINEAGLQHTGYTFDEIKGQLITGILSLPASNSSDLLDEIVDLSVSGSNIRNYQFDLVSHKGEKTPVLVTSDVLKIKNHAEGILLVCRNISDLK